MPHIDDDPVHHESRWDADDGLGPQYVDLHRTGCSGELFDRFVGQSDGLGTVKNAIKQNNLKTAIGFLLAVFCFEASTKAGNTACAVPFPAFFKRDNLSLSVSRVLQLPLRRL